jgi:hypothetical protein
MNTFATGWVARAALLIALFPSACGSAKEPPAPTVRTSPPPPELGPRIDRVGRPLVNFVLTDPLATATGKTHAQMQDEYNVGPIDSTEFTARFAGNLALLDAADGQCGNQLAAGPDPNNRDRYDKLAAVFSDDRLLLDPTAGGTARYFGIELSELGVGSAPSAGGLAPGDDFVSPTYSVIVAGISSPSDYTVSDGLDRGPAAPEREAFPFLGPPAEPSR